MKLPLGILFILACITLQAQSQKNTSVFEVIPLGVKGGGDESNLSSYAITTSGSADYVCLDAGTIYSGVQVAMKNGSIKSGYAEDFIASHIKGYLISHAHLDHVSGLILISPDDLPKNIYGLPSCLDVMREKYFTWKNWANFTNEGDKPQLNKYRYISLDPKSEVALENTSMMVTAYSLSHGNPYESTAFLIRYNESYLLYLGDTGADEIEKSTALASLWMQVRELAKAKKLKAIFIEVSFSNEQPVNKLFGHLTPDLLMKELTIFNGEDHLQDVSIVITHRKPKGNRESLIRKQLEELNVLKWKLVFPEQGKTFRF